MLKQLRNKKTAKKVWIVLAILIVPAFVLWGSGSLIRSKQESGYVGKISGRNISVTEFKEAMEAVKNQGIMLYGEKFFEMRKSMKLEPEAWDRLILLDESKKRKLNASDEEVIKLVQSYPFFQRDGRFDNRIYTDALQYFFRTQPRVFEEQCRQNLLISKLYQEITKGITATDQEIRDAYLKLNEEISLNYIASLPDDFEKEVAASEQDIKNYFIHNSLNFKQPLSFNMDYVLSESEDKIKNVASHLNKKSDFAKEAKDAGLSLKETGFFSQTDPIPGIGWSPEILSIISRLKTGEFSKILKTDKYYCILRLKETKEAYIPDFDKIKDKIKEVVIKEGARKISKARIEEAFKELKLEEEKSENVDLNKNAKKYGLKYGSTSAFKFNSYIEEIGSSDELWMKASKLQEDEISEIISLPSGFYIIKIRSRTPIDEKKFQTEKEEFGKTVLEEKKSSAFTDFLNGLRKKI